MSPHDPGPRNGAGYGRQASTSVLPGPLRYFVDQLDELRSANVPDMDQVGRLLVDLAADQEFFGPLIAEIPSPRPAIGGWSGPNGASAWCSSTGLTQ